MAAIPLELTVTVVGDPSSPLLTNGEIYDDDGDMLVSHVIVSQSWASDFVLDPGKYEYRFHVENAGGKFQLTLTNTDSSVVVDASSQLSTGSGAHFDYDFEVK